MWEVDENGVYTYSSPKVKDILGYEPEEVISKTPSDFMERDEARRIAAIFNNAVKFRNAFAGLENTNISKDGKKVVLETGGVPIFDSSGRFSGYRGIHRDISERKHLESQLRQSQKMEAIGTLAGGIAHDFNNILTSLIGYATLAQMKIGEDSPLKAYVEQILAASRKAADLTQSLLTFSRQQPITPRPIDINGTIRTTEKLLRRLLTEDIELRTSLTDDNAVVLADKSQMDQIFFNLVTNARDAMPQGGTLVIETEVIYMDEDFIRTHGFGEPGSFVSIIVSDTGTGIDRKTKEHIFDPFFTTKEVGKGTGLGLATVYGIVKQHSGYITVHSEPDEGTTFRIYLPKAMLRPNEGEDSALPVIMQGNETILIAEDDEEVRHFIEQVLREYGYGTIEARDGEDAIDKFKQHRNIDLIIIDSVMPKKNGREVYEQMHETNPHVKVLFTSGYTKDVVLDKGIVDGEFDFIAKPLKVDEVLAKIRTMLDR